MFKKGAPMHGFIRRFRWADRIGPAVCAAAGSRVAAQGNAEQQQKFTHVYSEHRCRTV